MPKTLPNRVIFLKVEISGHDDERRTIFDIILPEGLPFRVIQFKQITPKDVMVEAGLVIGNHLHPVKSQRWEFFVITGTGFTFRYRNPGGGIEEQTVTHGDGILVSPGASHAFKALAADSVLFGFCSKRFEKNDDEADILF